MMNLAATQTDTFEQQALICPQDWCEGGSWLVRRDTSIQNLWHVTHAAGGSWTIAAPEPICPRCGTTLRVSPGLASHDELLNILQPRRVAELLIAT